MTEIASISIEANPQYSEKLVLLLQKVMEIISEQIPISVDIAASYSNGSHEEQKFVSNLAQLLVTFLKEHSKLVEILDKTSNSDVRKSHLLALDYLLRISQVEDVEVFKVIFFVNNFLEVFTGNFLLQKIAF